MKFPCSHIFVIQCHKNLLEYTEDTCTDRWKLHHFGASSCFQANSSHGPDDGEPEVVVDFVNLDQATASKILTEQDKYKKALQVSQSLTQHLSSLGMNDFKKGLSILQTIKLMWDKGKKLMVIDSNAGK